MGETGEGRHETGERFAVKAETVLKVQSLKDALAPNELARLGTDVLAAFLAPRRWFGAKAGTPTTARIRDVVPLPWDDGRFAVARLEVTTSTGVQATYQLPLCVRSMAEIGDRRPKSVVARVDAGGEEALLFDAVEDGAFLRSLADALARGGSFGEASLRWIIEPIGAAALVVPDSTKIKVGSAEQSNTSIILGEEAILKLFRKLERGEQPDVELTRFLTVDAAFPYTPALLGTIRFEDGGGKMVAGMLQEFLPKSVDAWSYALERAKPYFAAPRDRDAPNAFLDDAERLGIVTRAMHEALARGNTPDLAPERADATRVEQWGTRAKQWVRDGLSLLERQLRAGALPKERAGEGEALARRRDHYLASVDEITREVSGDAGVTMRIHGDYHLGQVLRTNRDDFMIIDFEGEPARPLAERREKASPLRDVAGMLRSFAYAAATLGMEAKDLDVGTREIRIGRWERDTREAFLRGYLAGRAEEPASEILPSGTEHMRALLRLFETEKAFYELAYELNNRPEWTWIPMRGIAKLLA